MEKSRSIFLNFIITNNFWILLVVMVFTSFNWVMTFVDLSTLVYLNSIKWKLFADFSLVYILIFSPLLIFSLFRSYLRQHLSTIAYWILWVLIFIIYPIVIGFTTVSTFLPVNMNSEALTILGLNLALVDMVSNPFTGLNLKSNLSKWTSKVSTEFIVAALFIILPLQHGLRLNSMSGVDASFFLTAVSVILLYGTYYLFYLINHYFLVNKVYKEKGLIYYIFSFLGLMILFFIPIALMYYYLPGINKMVRLQLGEKWIGENPPHFFSSIYIGTITGMMYLSIPLTIIVQWFKQSQAITNLEKEKSQTELNLLKQQINPHFFFNTLNNVYSMSLKNDNKTSETIMQLSDLMRYVIYKGNQDKVALSEEVNYLQDFIELQRVRLLDNAEIDFSIDIQSLDLKVSPLLFIILVENGFKHGLEDSEDGGKLSIELIEKNKTIQLTCKNTFESKIENTTGLGLSNLRERLAILYPNDHTLNIQIENEIFTAILTLHI